MIRGLLEVGGLGWFISEAFDLWVSLYPRAMVDFDLSICTSVSATRQYFLANGCHDGSRGFSFIVTMYSILDM